MEDFLTSEYLRRTDTALGLVLNSLFDGVYIVDRSRRILFWNRGAEEMTGYTSEEVSGHCCAEEILDHIDEQGQPMCSIGCPLMEAILTGKDVRKKIFPKTKAGHRFPVITHVTALRDHSGAIIGALEVFRDMSKEEDFRILQEKFDALFRQYVSQTTYEQIKAQAHGADTDIAMRDLTTCYLDVVGFTALSEKSDPADMVGLLNSVFGICGEITHKWHGDIDKFIGDAIMSVFVDANDAVQAAREIVEQAIPELNQKRSEYGRDPIRVRIGINSGMLVQANIGTEDRKDLTVIGDVVNTAQRIESLAPQNGVMISESTFSRSDSGNATQFAFDCEVTVKNRETPVRLFRLKKEESGLEP